MLASHACYAFEVNLLVSNYAENFLVHTQNISFSIVLKHDKNRNIILWDPILVNGLPYIIGCTQNIQPYASACSERKSMCNYNILTQRRVRGYPIILSGLKILPIIPA